MSSASPAPPFAKSSDWLARIPFELWFFLALWLLYGVLVNSSNLTEFNLQQMGVEAIVERGHFYVEGSPTPQLQPQGDVFTFQNHLYAAKQPGQFMAGALVYFVLRAFGLSYLHQFLLTSALVTWFTAGFVTALASIVVYRLALAFAPNGSRLAAGAIALAFALATTAFPYAGIAHHDAIASGYLIAAFYLVYRLSTCSPRASLLLAAGAGLLLGLALTTSVLPVFMAAIVGIYFLFLRRWRALPFFLLGGLVGLAPLLYYDAVNFGNPFLLPNFAGNFSDTFFHLDFKNFVSKIKFYANFITLYVPIFWLGLVGWFLVPKTFRREQIVGLAMLGVLLGYTLNIDTTGDCQYGPRYLVPAMPLAALGLVGFSQIKSRLFSRVLVFALAIVGIFSFAVNLTGASFGAMYCNLDRYAFLQDLNLALQAKFWTYPLGAALLAPFLVCSFIFGIVLFDIARSEWTASVANASHVTNSNAFAARLKGSSKFRPLLLLTLLVAFFLRVFRLWELPPGLWLDEGFYGLDALRILQHPALTVFFPQNGGREPLFIYLQAVALGIWGSHSWVLRVVPIFAGVLTVVLAYRLGCALFASQPRSRFVGLVAAAALAVSYWHVNFSRLGMRVILLPAFGALTMWLFWRAWQSRRRRDFVWSGIALGLTSYTYLSARVLPFVLIGFALVALVLLWLQNRRSAEPVSALTPRALLLQMGIVLLVALVVSLPLLTYLVLNPGDLLGRTDSVSLTAENIAQTGGSAETTMVQAIAQNALRVAGMFFVQGDLNARHNLPGRPALDWLTALGFVVGLGFGIVRLRREPVYVLLLLWLVAMLLPSVLSTEAPHFLRTLGALPPAMILVADGLTRLWQKFLPQRAPSLLVLLVLLVGGVGTFRDYFLTWAKLPALVQESFDVNSQYLADRILQEIPKSDVLLPLRIYGRPTMQFALDSAFPQAKTLAAAPNKPLVIITSQSAEDRQWVLLHHDDAAGNMVYFPGAVGGLSKQNRGDPQYIDRARGVHAGQVISLRGGAKSLIVPPKPGTALDANFSGQIRLVGYDLNPPRLAPDQNLEVALYWQPLADLQRDYTVFVHVVDSAGSVYAQWDSQPVFGFYTTGLWRKDAIVTDLYPIHLPANTPPGEYQLEVGWLAGAQERLSVLDAHGQPGSDSLIFGKVLVTAP